MFNYFLKRPSRLTKPLYRFSRKAHQSEKGWDSLLQRNQMEFHLSAQIDLVGQKDGNLFIGQIKNFYWVSGDPLFYFYMGNR